MDWEKFFEEKRRVLQNWNEFTDDAIMGDGSIGAISGSNADTIDYPEDIEQHKHAMNNWIQEEQNNTLQEGFPEKKCPACGSFNTEPSYCSAGYMQCNTCGCEY